jgi:hypothetical protein
MNRRAVRAVRAVLVRQAAVPLLALLALSAPAAARVIDVGPDRDVKTIDAAFAKAQVGDEIVLQRGVEHLTDGTKVTVDAVEVRSADGPGAPAIVHNTSAE